MSFKKKIFKRDNVDNGSGNPNTDKVTIQETTIVSADDLDSIDFQNEVKMDYNDTVSLGTKESTSISENGIEYGIENEINIVSDTGSMTVKSGLEASFGENSFGLKHKQGYEEKNGNIEYKENNEINAAYNGKGFTVGESADSSTKIGNDDAYTKTSSGYSTKFGSGYSGVESYHGIETKTGPVEYGAKQTNSYTHKTEENKNGETVETETATQKNEISGGVDVGNGVKVTNSVGVEHSEKTSESKENYTEESTTSFSSKTRIEVDEEQAGKGAAVMAGIFNATQAVNESFLKEAFTMTETTEYSKGVDGEDASEAEGEAVAENIGKENAEQEAEAEAEAEEKSTKEQVEEDTKVDQELQEKSEELKNEHENPMDYDREEYAEELEDYSYDQPGEGETGLESVDFSENESEGESSSPDSGGESAGNDYDYGYGY